MSNPLGFSPFRVFGSRRRVYGLVVFSLGLSLVLGIGLIQNRSQIAAETDDRSDNATDSGSSDGTSPLPRPVKVVALGRLEPQGEVIQVGAPSGARIDRLLVNVGDWVKAQQVLAYLDNYDERLAERNLAQTQLQEAQQQLAAETTFQAAQIEEAQSRIRQIDQPQALEIEAQTARLAELKAERALALQDLERDRALQEEGAISQRDLDRRETQVEELQAQVKTAQATLSQLTTARQSNLDNAQAQLKASQANRDLAQIRIFVESARQNLALAEARLANSIIKAPQDGRVLRLIARQGEAIPAAPSGGNEGILELGNTREMMVVAEVHESNIDQVQVGQPATITSRNGAFTEPLTGTVAEIGWLIFKNDVLDDDPAANADARVVEVKIRLDQSDRVETLTNLQVDVQIEI